MAWKTTNFSAELQNFAAEVGETGPIAIEGARTRWDNGGELAPDTRTIAAPSGIAEYSPDEMTVSVRCGTMVSALHEELASAGQRTALPDRGGSVGGAISVGENDVCVLGRGRLRDAVLGVRYVSAEGLFISGGGPTVKNVTGFDIPRLFTGALGTLGCLAEVVIRTNPIPQRSQWYRSDGVDPFVIRRTLYRPSAVLWDGTTTWVLLEGKDDAVEDESKKLATLGDVQPVADQPKLPTYRWSIDPSLVESTVARRDKPLLASVGVGTIWSEQPQPARAVSAEVAQISERLKNNFDPTGRLNPGRLPGRS